MMVGKRRGRATEKGSDEAQLEQDFTCRLEHTFKPEVEAACKLKPWSKTPAKSKYLEG